jgi:hypothetical protein
MPPLLTGTALRSSSRASSRTVAVFRDGLAANTGNQIAARRVKELERQVAKRAAARDEFARRPPVEVVEPLLAGPGRAGALRFLAFSIRAIQRIDGTRLAVTEIPSDHRFRVVGDIYFGGHAVGGSAVRLDRQDDGRGGGARGRGRGRQGDRPSGADVGRSGHRAARRAAGRSRALRRAA